jgi:cytochrome c peroxidase
MKKTEIIPLLLALLALLPASSDADQLLKQAQSKFKTIPQTVPEIKGKAFTKEKIALGKLLFFEPRLSASALISCNTCHNLGLGGADFQETSIGHRWQKGPRNSPTVFNSVFNVAQFWDGRAADLKEQAKGRSRRPWR